MNILKKFNQFVKSKYTQASVAVSLALVSSPVFASVDVSSIVGEIADAKTPVASVAGASAAVLVVMRVWKLIRRAI